ncbi:PTS system glucose-specific EIIA component [Buchnera aphidicola (Thelaxes suberi)]|uniref:PTS glucose transporter subunit IIA n=1 Tax=Buchnera aphidicola TaxID=9 RepID=UPI003463DFB2
MGFFSNFLKTKPKNSTTEINIVAPLSGSIINIESVPDTVFAEKIVGDGIAIIPSNNEMVAPIDGEINKIPDTLHAFSIKSKEGIELFVHFGIDTVNLKGKGFLKIIGNKKEVKKGDVIINFDLNFLIKNAKSIITPIVISNMEKIKTIKKMSGTVIAGKTTVMIVTI